MKNLFYSFLLLAIGGISFLSITFAQSDDEFLGSDYDYVTTQEDAQGVGGSFIKKLDFFGTRLLSNALLYGYYFPSCFTAKEIGTKTVIYAKPSFCYPRGANKNAEKIQISELKIQDLMDGKYKIANQTIFILIPLLFFVGLFVCILMFKCGIQTKSDGLGKDSGNSNNSFLKNIEGILSGRIGGRFLEKILGKNPSSKGGKYANFLVKRLCIFLVLLLLFGNLLSFSLASGITNYFTEGLRVIRCINGIGFLYLLFYLIFLAIVFILVKYSLLPFIQKNSDLEKYQSAKFLKSFWIGVFVFFILSFVISKILIWIFSAIII